MSSRMNKILISACLLGKPVRYNGSDLLLDHQILSRWLKEGRTVAICPEVESGMPIPRPAAEISGGNGLDVILGRAEVINRDKENVTACFLAGAQVALEKCRENRIKIAVLTESSPSCGSRTIHDGRFTGRKIEGEGVTTALLRQNRIEVFSQFDIQAADRALRAAG